jgi:hypothetical protein
VSATRRRSWDSLAALCRIRTRLAKASSSIVAATCREGIAACSISPASPNLGRRFMDDSACRRSTASSARRAGLVLRSWAGNKLERHKRPVRRGSAGGLILGLSVRRAGVVTVSHRLGICSHFGWSCRGLGASDSGQWWESGPEAPNRLARTFPQHSTRPTRPQLSAHVTSLARPS